jgi:hypothetical protein
MKIILKKNYEVQFLVNLILNDEFEKKIIKKNQKNKNNILF